MASSGSNTEGMDLVIDLHLPTAFFRSDDGVGEDGHYTLTHEPHDVVENVGVVRINKVVGMNCRGEELARHVFPGVDAMDTGDGERSRWCRWK